MKHRDARSRRGFKRDEAATIAARFEDYRSFVSQPKAIKGESTVPKAHLVLYGLDKIPVRAKVFWWNRALNGGVNRCSECGERVLEDLVFAEDLGSQAGEWDHIRNKTGERCDCPENGRVLCQGCHRSRHPQVKFRRTAPEQVLLLSCPVSQAIVLPGPLPQGKRRVTKETAPKLG